MRNTFMIVALIAAFVSAAPALADAYTLKNLDQRVSEFKDLNTSAQALTAGWVDIGPEIDVKSFSAITVLITLDINDSTGVQVRPLGLTAKGATDEYLLPIKSQTAAYVGVKPLIYNITDNADQKIMLEIPVNAYNVIQMQIKATVAGASAGTVLMKFNASYL